MLTVGFLADEHEALPADVHKGLQIEAIVRLLAEVIVQLPAGILYLVYHIHIGHSYRHIIYVRAYLLEGSIVIIPVG